MPAPHSRGAGRDGLLVELHVHEQCCFRVGRKEKNSICVADMSTIGVQVQFSLISIGPQQRDIQDVCKALGIGLIAYSPLGLGMLTGKYDVSSGRLPKGPRGLLFRQILPGLEPLLSTMEAIAQERRKSVSQVRPVPRLHP